MGMNERIYLGIHVELEYKTEAVENWIRKCPNGHTLSTTGALFCSYCGEKIVEVNEPIIKSLEYYDLVDKGLIFKDEDVSITWDDFFYTNMSSLKGWLIDNSLHSKYGEYLDDGYTCSIELTKNAGTEISIFISENQYLIDSLKKHCKSVIVKYGILKYYN